MSKTFRTFEHYGFDIVCGCAPYEAMDFDIRASNLISPQHSSRPKAPFVLKLFLRHNTILQSL
jgi:hypothetical protein